MTRTDHATCRAEIDRALTRFPAYCGTGGHTIGEIVTLAETVSNWRVEIAGAVLHGLRSRAGRRWADGSRATSTPLDKADKLRQCCRR